MTLSPRWLVAAALLGIGGCAPSAVDDQPTADAGSPDSGALPNTVTLVDCADLTEVSDAAQWTALPVAGSVTVSTFGAGDGAVVESQAVRALVSGAGAGGLRLLLKEGKVLEAASAVRLELVLRAKATPPGSWQGQGLSFALVDEAGRRTQRFAEPQLLASAAAGWVRTELFLNDGSWTAEGGAVDLSRLVGIELSAQASSGFTLEVDGLALSSVVAACSRPCPATLDCSGRGVCSQTQWTCACEEGATGPACATCGTGYDLQGGHCVAVTPVVPSVMDDSVASLLYNPPKGVDYWGGPFWVHNIDVGNVKWWCSRIVGWNAAGYAILSDKAIALTVIGTPLLVAKVRVDGGHDSMARILWSPKFPALEGFYIRQRDLEVIAAPAGQADYKGTGSFRLGSYYASMVGLEYGSKTPANPGDGPGLIRLQEKLLELGYLPMNFRFNAELHVVLGSVTQQALNKFQLKNGLPQTGKVDRTTALYLQYVDGATGITDPKRIPPGA